MTNLPPLGSDIKLLATIVLDRSDLGIEEREAAIAHPPLVVTDAQTAFRLRCEVYVLCAERAANRQVGGFIKNYAAGSMERELNPYKTPDLDSVQLSTRPDHRFRIGLLALTAIAGVVMGSYISVEIGYWWYPQEPRDIEKIANDMLAAILGSPLAMTLGIFPSLGFYGPFHGLVMMLGFATAAYGTWYYFRTRNTWFAWLTFLGMVLWSHNNHLAYSALMSV